MKLEARKVLIVEDDYMQATDLCAIVEKANCHVLGPVSDEAGALLLLEKEVPDVAVIDLNLGTGMSYKVALELADQHVPFIFATGYDCLSPVM